MFGLQSSQYNSAPTAARPFALPSAWWPVLGVVRRMGYTGNSSEGSACLVWQRVAWSFTANCYQGIIYTRVHSSQKPTMDAKKHVSRCVCTPCLVVISVPPRNSWVAR